MEETPKEVNSIGDTKQKNTTRRDKGKELDHTVEIMSVESAGLDQLTSSSNKDSDGGTKGNRMG